MMNVLGLIDLPAVVVFPLLAVVLLILHTKWKFSYWKKQGIPTPTPWPIIGNMVDFFGKKAIHEIDIERRKKYGNTYGLYEPSRNTLVISDPEDLKAIFVKDFDVFTNRRKFEPPKEDKLFRHFLSVVRDDEWNFIRSVVSPTFSGLKLKRMTERVVECCETLRNCLEKVSKEEKEFDVKRYSLHDFHPLLELKLFGAYTLDVIANTAFKTKINTQEDPDNNFVKFAKQIFQPRLNWRIIPLLLFPKLATKLGLTFADQSVFNFFSDVVKKIIKLREKETQQPNDFLSLLRDSVKDAAESEQSKNVANGIDPQKSKIVMTEDMMVSQCVLFFVAGYDTTATTLTMTAYNLAQNTECQNRLVEEIDTAVKKHGEISYESVGDMPYLNAVVKETLRVYPPITRTEREAGENYQLGDIYLEKGTHISIPVHSIHRDPANWPEPDKFDPERFMCDPSEINPYKYLPFGAGRRNCVAMRFALLEVKLAIAVILQKYKFVKSPKTTYPPKLKGLGLLSPTDIFLGVESRT